MNRELAERIRLAWERLAGADRVIIGGGAGLSAAAGLTYSGERFTQNFADFIRKYGMTDMYSAGFYPFRTQEEKWAYWSRHIVCNRWDPPALPLYRALQAFAAGRDCFVVTTNVDAQFEKAGFAPERVFAVQGDYGKLQCARGCHDALYDDEALVREMAAAQKDCRIPSSLVPKCPVCGGEMEVNIRKDAFFVQDPAWYGAAARCDDFFGRAAKGKTVLLELGVGFNTPTIIRFPFEHMAYRCPGATLIRLNMSEPEGAPENAEKTLSFPEDMAGILPALLA